MNVDNQFQPLKNGEVLSIDESAKIFIGHRTFKVGELTDAIKSQLAHNLDTWTESQEGLFSREGVYCEALRFSSGGWVKGKVRINLEFAPEASTTPTAETPASPPQQVLTTQQVPTANPEQVVPVTDTTKADAVNLAAVSLVSESSDLTPAISTEKEDFDLPGVTQSANLEVLETTADDWQLGIAQTSAFDFIPTGEAPVLDVEETDVTTNFDFGSDTNDFDLGGISQFSDFDLTSEVNGLDLTGSADENEFNFDMIPSDDENEFDFGNLSDSNQPEENSTDSLLDGVWKDMNPSS